MNNGKAYRLCDVSRKSVPIQILLHFWLPEEELQRCPIHFWALRGDRTARIIIPILSSDFGAVPGRPTSDLVPTSHSLPADFGMSEWL